MSRTRSRPTPLADNALLAVGFLSLASAVVVAHTSPATGYELSPYTGTPAPFWLLFGLSLFLSLFVSLRSATVWSRRLALVLGGGAATTFVGLPIVRGYRFYGAGDALTHLGWMRGIRSGAFLPTELPYPALHTVANVIAATLGIDLTHAALLVIVALAALFFLFVALATSLVFESPYSATAGAFSAFLLLPITTLSTFLVPHSMSQAILFSSLFVYLLLKYARGGTAFRSRSALGALLAITSVALVLYHPQLAAHLLAALLGICVLQFLYRRARPEHPIADHRPIYAQTSLLLVAFLAWTSEHGFIVDSAEYALTGTLEYLLGEGSASESVGSQGTSITELGGSVPELFLKLFGPTVVFIALTGLLVAWSIWERDGRLTRRTHGFVPYFVVSLGGLTGVFALYFLGSYGDMYFRVLGLMLLLVTIAGSAAIAYGVNASSRLTAAPSVHAVVVVGFGILLLVSLVAVFPSPYIYNSSPHVTDMSLTGHETAFENGDPDATYAGIRAGPNRYADAVHGERDRTRHYEAVTAAEIDDGLVGQFEDDRYLTVTRNDYDRELIAYQELRYSQSQLDALGTQGGGDRVLSNGEFEVYYVRGSGE